MQREKWWALRLGIRYAIQGAIWLIGGGTAIILAAWTDMVTEYGLLRAVALYGLLAGAVAFIALLAFRRIRRHRRRSWGKRRRGTTSVQ